MNRERRNEARRAFIEAVTEEMKEADKNYSPEAVAALKPFVEIADHMARRLAKSERVRAPKLKEAAE